MNVSQEQAARLGFWVTLLLSIFAWAPAAYPGYWQAHEGFLPVFNAPRAAAIAGIATLPDLWRGTGSGAFIPAQPFLVLGLSATAAVRIVFGLAFILGGLGMYSWLRARLGDRPAGLAALVFMLWPPLLATVYIRGSLADALVVGIVPLVLAGLVSYVETRSPSGAGVAVLGLLWIWRTQAGLALAVSVILLAYVLFVERSRLAALVVGVSAAAGFVSLVPLLNITAPSQVHFEAGFVSLYSLLAGGWPLPAFGVATPPVSSPAAPWATTVPITLGAALLILGVAALWFWRSSRLGMRTNVLARMLAFSSVVIVLGILLALPLSQPFWQVSGLQRLYTYPWQILLVTAPFCGLLAGSLPALQPGLAQTRFWSVLVALVLLGSYPFLQADFTRVQPPERPIALFGPLNEIVILDAQLQEDPSTADAVLDVTWQVLRTPDFDYNVFFQAQVPEEGVFRRVAQLDTQPLQGQQPATTWQPGRIYTDTYRLDLSTWHAESDASEPLRFDFGYYDWRNGVRLPVDGGIDDKLMFYGR